MSLLYSVHCEILELPTFQPNEYLFKTHADKGKERWEIYAWAVREAMSRSSGIKTSEQSYRNGLEYFKLMGNGGYATKKE